MQTDKLINYLKQVNKNDSSSQLRQFQAEVEIKFLKAKNRYQFPFEGNHSSNDSSLDDLKGVTQYDLKLQNMQNTQKLLLKIMADKQSKQRFKTEQSDSTYQFLLDKLKKSPQRSVEKTASCYHNSNLRTSIVRQIQQKTMNLSRKFIDTSQNVRSTTNLSDVSAKSIQRRTVEFPKPVKMIDARQVKVIQGNKSFQGQTSVRSNYYRQSSKSPDAKQNNSLISLKQFFTQTTNARAALSSKLRTICKR